VNSPSTSRALYLYEVVEIIGQGQYDYMEHLWQDPVLRMPEMFGLQGSFYVCAAGGAAGLRSSTSGTWGHAAGTGGRPTSTA
jgi:hypothetical protein